MLIVLAFILLFHLIGAVMLFVATIHNAWWVVSPAGQDAVYADLWLACNATCHPLANSHTAAATYLQVIQAAMILGTILCCVSFFVFILQLFRLKQGERFVFSAIIQLLASLCVMVAASIYTAENHSFHDDSLKKGSFGSSYFLAWVSFPVTLSSGLVYLLLRKRK
ncbi:epithelial membrane protein 2 [Betta splendens]|uniref:Epithelial membrane protein 2 n=1 Tax=Betta splendens TaxID=158456 RepID=A0A6P7N868_BETSP|nr:epithelial membrane protein 2 [Betta splendens]